MNKIAVVTTTRAEYGLLAPVIRELRKSESEDLRVELIVTGTHLSDDYGKTINEIKTSGLRIDHRIRIPVKSDSEIDISTNQAKALIAFTKLFSREDYRAVLVLGDRYETLAVAIAAGNTRTPLFHMCGGDTTEGAIDEWIRHAITKISYLHFVTNMSSYKRVIQLGEEPSRVFNYGSTSIDNIINVANMDRVEALESIGLPDCSYALCTYHPVTMDMGDVDRQICDFLEAIRTINDLQFVVTKSNADQGGARINQLLDVAEKEIENIHIFPSLGVRRYLSLMKHSEVVVGNSSSGIIEAPAFHVPTVNIGDRQNGRLQSESIINCRPDTNSIVAAIKLARSEEHKAKCKYVISPYGNGHSAEKIAKTIVYYIDCEEIDLKKKFYDLGAI